MGPPIAIRLPACGEREPADALAAGRLRRGMPPSAMPEAEMAGLLMFVRTLQREVPPVVRKEVRTTDGRTLEGQVLGEGLDDLQLLTDDLRAHLLRRTGDRYREVTS